MSNHSPKKPEGGRGGLGDLILLLAVAALFYEDTPDAKVVIRHGCAISAIPREIEEGEEFMLTVTVFDSASQKQPPFDYNKNRIQIHSIDIGREIDLDFANNPNFEIEKIGNDKAELYDPHLTGEVVVEWRVTPLEDGDHTLLLKPSIPISSASQIGQNTISLNLQVENDFFYSAKKAFIKYWLEELITLVIAGLVFFAKYLWSLLQEKRKNKSKGIKVENDHLP
jgi:hypothetical protein